MVVNYIAAKEILDLEKEIGFKLEANERPTHLQDSGLPRFYVSFKDGEVMQGGCLVSCSGNGNTVDEALKDYSKQISDKRLAFGAYTPQRKEIQFPKVIHTKLVGF
jgi:hypothetical protein